eukprot:3940365-Rhodomonas_salina.3
MSRSMIVSPSRSAVANVAALTSQMSQRTSLISVSSGQDLMICCTTAAPWAWIGGVFRVMPQPFGLMEFKEKEFKFGHCCNASPTFTISGGGSLQSPCNSIDFKVCEHALTAEMVFTTLQGTPMVSTARVDRTPCPNVEFTPSATVLKALPVSNTSRMCLPSESSSLNFRFQVRIRL